MKDDKGQAVERNDETVTYTYERPQESYAQTGITNINDINKRNAEQEKQEKKSSYTVAGIIVLFIAFIIVAVYFLS
jgi:hypothetical protein